jgi:hypothetical protein
VGVEAEKPTQSNRSEVGHNLRELLVLSLPFRGGTEKTKPICILLILSILSDVGFLINFGPNGVEVKRKYRQPQEAT